MLPLVLSLVVGQCVSSCPDDWVELAEHCYVWPTARKFFFYWPVFFIGLFLLADCQEVLEGGRDPLQFLWRTSRLRPQHGGQQPDPVKGKKERSKDTFLARRKEEGG